MPITAQLIAITGLRQRWLDLAKRLMLMTFATMATRPIPIPSQGPTPSANPTNGSKNGRRMYAIKHRMPEMTIAKLKARCALNSLISGVSTRGYLSVA